MSTLDTPVYHDFLRRIAPSRKNAVVADIGGGDGRNALPWLEWGYKRVVVIDPVAAALQRFRAVVARRHASWLDNILLIEGDARALPLANGCADRVTAIESLYYLNEDYEKGLRECRRIMRARGRLLLSDRDYEGGLLTRLLYYGGVQALIRMGDGREMWDGEGRNLVRTRCFTQAELIKILARERLHVETAQGISMFSLLLSFLAKQNQLGSDAELLANDAQKLLLRLGRDGTARRCHVLIASREEGNKRRRSPRRRPFKRRARSKG